VYERTGYYTWTALPLTITNPSLSSPYILHAPRPVFVGPDITEIGLIYQADNCLFWLTLTPTTVGPWTELSSYSNNTENENPPVCNLPDPPQELWGDTAASVATDPVSGDQYLGFVVGALTDSSVYALTYQASSGSWLNVGTVPVTIDPTTPTYVKTTFATAADSNTYAYMFVNVAGQLQFFASQTLSAGSTMYNSVDYLTHSGPGTGQSYSNPRIDAPEYITYSATSPTITTIPVWEQYTFEAGPVESLIYWKNVPISE
jgi:hypothetical protein